MHSLPLAQAGDVSLLKTMLQEFATFERLPVTMTEADLLREVQTHLRAREIDFLQPRSADSRKAVEGLLREKGFVGRREDFHPARFAVLSAAH